MRTIAGAALLALSTLVPAAAQTAGGSSPGDAATRKLTAPGEGGVAGTGLGGTTGKPIGAPGAPGTGQSVKGPPGQGIDGRGIPQTLGTDP